MKIKSVDTEIVYIIETEDGEFYRRSSCNDWWERLYDMSWEFSPFNEEAELEKLFQEYMKEKKLKLQQTALNRMYENEDELGLDWE